MSIRTIGSGLDFQAACALAKLVPGRVVISALSGAGFDVLSSEREQDSAPTPGGLGTGLGELGLPLLDTDDELTHFVFGGRWLRVANIYGKGLAVIDPARQPADGEGRTAWFAYRNAESKLYEYDFASAPESEKQARLVLKGYAAFLHPRLTRPSQLDEEPFEITEARLEAEARERAFDRSCQPDPRWSEDETIDDDILDDDP